LSDAVYLQKVTLLWQVTEYPELQRVRKELNLLQKLYGLYNDVLEKVGGYYDTPCNYYNDVLEKVGGYYDTPYNYYSTTTCWRRSAATTTRRATTTVQRRAGEGRRLLRHACNYYNDVLEKVGGYYDTPWHDIDIDVINTELIDFQNKCVVHIP